MGIIDLDAKPEGQKKPFWYVDDDTIIPEFDVNECYLSGNGGQFVGSTPEEQLALIREHNARIRMREEAKYQAHLEAIQNMPVEETPKREVPFKSLGEFEIIRQNYELLNDRGGKDLTASPLIRLMKNDYVEIVAYNIQIPQLNTNTRTSSLREQAATAIYDPSPNPINWMPVHTESAVFNMTKLNNVWNITRDGRRVIAMSRDSDMFNKSLVGRFLSGVIVGYMGNDKKINPLLEPAYKMVRTLLSNRVVYRTQYGFHYDEVKRMVSALRNEEYDRSKDHMDLILSDLLSQHPDYLDYGMENHRTPQLIYVCVDTIVDAVSLDNDIAELGAGDRHKVRTFTIPYVDDILYVGEWRKCPTWNDIRHSINESERNLITNGIMNTLNGVTVVRHGDEKAYFYKVGNKVYRTKSVNDPSRPDGIYIYHINVKEVKDSEGNPKALEYEFVSFDKAEENGFYDNERDCEIGGNIQKQLEAQIENMKLNKVELETKKLHTESSVNDARHQQGLEEVEARLKEMQLKEQLNELNKDAQIELLQQKIKTEEMKSYYESRSYDRKDTSESLKMTPVIIGGVLGLATAIGGAFAMSGKVVGLASAFTINPVLVSLFAAASMTETGFRLLKGVGKSIGHVYGGIIKGVRSIGKGVSKAVGSVWDGAKYVAKGVGNAVSDTCEWVCDGIGGAWDFIFG